MRMQQKNWQSTKPKITTDLPLSMPLDLAPPQDIDNVRMHNLFFTIETSSDIRKSYSEQTGKLPHQSTRGNQYVMILYDYDSNLILSNPIKNRQAAELTVSWETLFIKLHTNGHAPEIHILDNESSEELRKAFKKYQVTFQLVLPHVHLQNAAERAIQPWKNHFLEGMATLNPNFPIQEWDRLLPQRDITLNLLQSSRRQPNISAYAATFGNFNFNLNPIAPPGTCVLVHEKHGRITSYKE